MKDLYLFTLFMTIRQSSVTIKSMNKFLGGKGHECFYAYFA
jgi:hypothetical protein